MAKYTEVFKNDVKKAYFALKNEGGCEVNGVQISNVRDLVKYFGISSYTLYKWNEKTIDDSFETSSTIVEEISDVKEIDFFGEDLSGNDWRMENKTDNFFNGRYFAWMGARLNVPYASRNAKETNMLKIGLELIKRSGLVDCDNVKKAMKEAMGEK